MEKFMFRKKLTEAVLTYENGQIYVTANGEKRAVRSPVSMKAGSIEEKGIPCLIFENANPKGTEDKVAAVMFDDLRREGKDWVCVDSVIMEQAVGYFLESHKMEKMTGGYCSVVMGHGNGKLREDFLLDGVCAIEIKVSSVGIEEATGSYADLRLMSGFFERFQKHVAELAAERNEIQKIIVLIILPFKGDGSLQTALNEKAKQDLEAVSAHGIKVEFWSAEMGIDKSGISLLSYDEVTEMVLRG